ncbi:hypothetical protein B0H94_11645 [Salsuginibacillus halophilus]|uniref:Uncharacterized protein n=1 Tax=Salsuginibacillus halophilus TaxID=517424 RepID=A0A2P8H827_9BACI|nr:hypothetical protein [Salsuginibacillus halophilus]PSL42340.1 hypothetical protein B0H94_11645 [Salsuginibacillus halophilus]
MEAYDTMMRQIQVLEKRLERMENDQEQNVLSLMHWVKQSKQGGCINEKTK